MPGRVLEFEVKNQPELSRLLDPSLQPLLGHARPERRQAVPGSEVHVFLPLGKFEDEPIRLWCRVVHERTAADGVHLGLRFLEPKNRYHRQQLERVSQLRETGARRVAAA